MRILATRATRVSGAGLLAGLMVLSACGGDAAETTGDGGEFTYDGGRLTIVTTWDAGGTGDVYARTLERHLSGHLPGEPQIVVENRVGGGHNIGASYLYSQAEADGFTIGIVPSHRVVGSIIGEEGVDFDAQEFTWLASLAARSSVCITMSDRPFETVDDLLGSSEPWRVGAVSTGDVANTVGEMANEDLGANFDVVLGYPADADILLAMEQGELDGTCSQLTTTMTARPEWFENDIVHPLLVVGAERDPDLPDVPAVTELDWSPEYLTAIEAYAKRFLLTIPVIAPPGLPDEVRTTLVEGLRETANDPAFVEDLEQAGQAVVDPLFGDEVSDLVDSMFDAPMESWDLILEAQEE